MTVLNEKGMTSFEYLLKATKKNIQDELDACIKIAYASDLPSIVVKGVVDRLMAALAGAQTRTVKRQHSIDEITLHNNLVQGGSLDSSVQLRSVPNKLKFTMKHRKPWGNPKETILLDSRTIKLDDNGNIFFYF